MAGSVSFDSRLAFINHHGACVAHDFVLGIRASGTTDYADDIVLLDQWNTASKRSDSTKCEQIVKLHKLNAILEDLRWPLAAGRSRRLAPCAPQSGCSAGIGYRYVHFPTPLFGLCHGSVNGRLGLLWRYRTPIRRCPKTMSSHQQDLPDTTLFCCGLSLGRFTKWQFLANRDY